MINKKWICLRGLARGNGHWGEFPNVLKTLDPDIDLELLEIPGNGTRNNEVTPISVAEVIAKIKSVSRIVKENKTFNLIGISLGGMIGLKWTELFPDEIEKLIVVNSSLSQFSPTTKRLRLKQLFNFVKAIGEKDFANRESIMMQIVSSDPKKNELALKAFIEFSKKYPIHFSNFLRQLVLAKLIKVNQVSTKSHIKILCSEQDQLVHFSCSQEIAKAFSLKIEIHSKAGHDLPLDDPNWVAQQLINL